MYVFYYRIMFYPSAYSLFKGDRNDAPRLVEQIVLAIYFDESKSKA